MPLPTRPVTYSVRMSLNSAGRAPVWSHSVNSTRTFGKGRVLIHPNIIDQHLLRENCRRIGVSRPATSDCHVQNNKKPVIKNPRSAGGKIRRRARLVKDPVDIKANYIWFPLESESVEIIRKLPAV